MNHILIALLFVSLSSFAAPKTQAPKVVVPAVQAVEVVRGRVFERGSDQKTPLFTYERRVWKEGELTKAQSSYFSADGKLAHREDYTFKANDLLSYDYDQKQVDEHGSAKINGKKISMSFSEDGETKSKELEDDGVLIAPLAIGYMLNRNWDKLMNDETIQARFILVERLDTVGFSFKKKKDLMFEGKEAVQIQMKPTSFFISSIVDPIQMIFEKNGEHRLLQSDGRLPVRVPKYNPPKKRGDWKAMDAILKLDY